MEELEAIVQRMIDAGEPESNIAAVIQEYNNTQQAGKTQPQVTGAPVEATAAPDTVSNLEPISSVSLEKQQEAKRKVGKAIIERLDPTGLAGALPEGMAINFARAGAFLGRTVAGISDAITNYGGTAASLINPISGPGQMARFLASDDIAKKQQLNEIRENIDIDFSSLYEAANAIDDLKPKYFDEQGNEQDIYGLLSNQEYGKAFDVAISDAVSSAPSLAISIAFPLIGSAALGVSTAGQTFEEELKERPDATLNQLYSSSFLKGLAEFGTEYAGGKLANAIGGFKTVGGSTEALRTLASNAVGTILTKAGAGFFTEGATEFATTIAQEYTDELVYGDEKNAAEVLRQGFNSFVVGGLLGGPTTGTGATINVIQTRQNKEKVYIAAAPKKAQTELFLKNQQIASIKNEIENTPEELRGKFEEYLKEAEQAVKETENNIYAAFDNLSKKELQQYANQLDEAGKQIFIARSKVGNKEVKERAAEKARKALKANQDLFGNINFYNAKVEEQIANELKAKELIEERYKRQKGYMPSDFTMEQLSADEIVKLTNDPKDAKTEGLFIGNRLIINKDIVTNTNVGGHEILHALVSKQFKVDNESVKPLIDSLRNYLQESEEGQRILERIDERIKNNYSDSKGNIQQGALEEYLNIFTDIYANEGIEYNESAAEKLKNETNRLIQGFGLNNVVELNTGRDVFNFLRNYSKNVNSKNPFLIKAALNVKIKSDLLTEKEVGPEQVQQEEQAYKKSISSKDKQEMMDLYNRRMEGIERTEYTKNKPLPARLENELVGKFYGYVNTIVNQKFKQVEEEAFEKEDAVAVLMGEVVNAIRTFNPAKNDDISGYVASIIARRQSMIFQDVKTEFTEGVEAAAAETEEIIQREEIIKQKGKDLLLDAIDIDVDVENKSYNQHVQDALTKNVKLAVKTYNDEISANRTITPFVANVKKGLADDLRTITKKFINQYGYETFLNDYKNVLLQNFTTTYLAKHPLFRKGIEKSIGGAMETDNQGNKMFKPNWTLPQEISKGKFEWIDENGKKAKIDRDNAGARGLTSGPEFIRRSPKINSVIIDNEFIDYHFQDGALRKKKKQNPEDALAMQLASEIGFEILKNDLNSNGPISQELAEVAELRGEIIGKLELEKIVKDIDRGIIKRSVSMQHVASSLIEDNLILPMFDAWAENENNQGLKQFFNSYLDLDNETAEKFANIFDEILNTIIPEGRLKSIPRKEIEKELNKKILEGFKGSENIWLFTGGKYDKLTKDRNGVKIITPAGRSFVKAYYTQVLESQLQNKTKEEQIKYIDDFLFYEASTFLGAQKLDFLNTNQALWEQIISPLVNKFNLKDIYKIESKSIKKKVNGKWIKTNSPSEYKIDEVTKQLKIAENPAGFNLFSSNSRTHLLNTWKLIKAAKNERTAKNYIGLSLSNVNSSLRRAAQLKYIKEDIQEIGAQRTKNNKTTIWEHMTTSSFVGRSMMANFYNIISDEELGLILDNYYVAFTDISIDKALQQAKLVEVMGELYNKIGMTPEETRYKNIDFNKENHIEYNTAGSPVKRSISDVDINRMNDMISETGKITKEEISEVTASRLGRTKGKFRFFIPPSADDFMGHMYYMLRKSEIGNEDLEFIKEKLIKPFTKGQAAFDTYKLQTLAQFREFKKLIRKIPKAKLSSKNDLGFTNEEAVRVYIWNKQGVDIPGISKNEISSLVKLVEGNADLLSFAGNVSNLLAAQGGYPSPQENWFGGSITIDVLEHINEISRKEFFAEFIEASENFFGKLNNRGEIQGPIANKLRAAYGDNYVESLSDILYRMKNGRGREFGKNKLVNQLNNWISNSVGAVMFLNARSALLQQVSLVNFINLSDNNPIKFAAAIANTKQYWADYLALLNSDYLVQRRSGIKIDVNQDELVKAAESGRNPVQSVISLILKKGFVLTTWGDSHAIATGGAAFYRNRINTYLNDGLSQAEAEEKAFNDFKELAEESQQSSRPDRISKQQASTIGRLVLAWANTPMQYARITKKAALDLINGRGDWKTNTSKLIYYGAIQNLMFTYLQQGLFAMIFDGEDEEEEDMDKYGFAFNSMADGFLRGLGFGGAVVATSKNMVLEAIDQAKGRGDYDEVVWEALKLSPPLGSKISKARAVGRTFGWKQEREKVFTEGFSLDNPAFEAVGKAVSATTNIPLDRVVRKLDNITYPVRHDVEFWQAAALYLGWGQWELGLKDVKKHEKQKQKPKAMTTKELIEYMKQNK